MSDGGIDRGVIRVHSENWEEEEVTGGERERHGSLAMGNPGKGRKLAKPEEV
jgi:hypothetical protein